MNEKEERKGNINFLAEEQKLNPEVTKLIDPLSTLKDNFVLVEIEFQQ